MWRERGRAWAQFFTEHQAFFALALAAAVFRAFALVYLKPGGFLLDEAPDSYFYFETARLTQGGQWPFLAFWSEYPPLMPGWLALAYQLSLHFPAWHLPIFWPNLIFRSVLWLCDLGNLSLMYLIAARLYPRERAMLVATLWALLFAPFLSLLAWFEPMALFFLLWALYALLTERWKLAGVAMGVGFMVKVFPAVLWPVGVGLIWQRYRSSKTGAVWPALLKLTLSAALAVSVIAAPLVWAAPQYVLAWWQGLVGRSSWETVWALLEGFTSFGQVAPLANRNDPLTAVFTVHPATLPWGWIGLAFAAVFVYALTRKMDWHAPITLARLSLLSVVMFLLYSKGYSPQWAVYPGALALLALPLWRGLGYALLLDAYVIAEGPVANVLFVHQPWVAVLVISLRTIVFIALGLEAFAGVWSNAFFGRWVQRAALPGVLALSVGAALIAAPRAAADYRATRLAADPLAQWAVSLTPAPTLVLSQPDVAERLMPYLPDTATRYFPNGQGTAWAEVEAWLSSNLSDTDQAWLVFNAETSSEHQNLNAALRGWLDQHGCPVVQAWHGPVWAGQYVLTPAPPMQPLSATFANGVQLQAATVPTTFAPGDAVCVRLTWQSTQALSEDHAIFLHWLTPDGQLVAQSDVWPEPPTRTWQPGQTYTTAHGLLLPADLSPGTYALHVGLYTADGTRARLENGDDAARLAAPVLQP